MSNASKKSRPSHLAYQVREGGKDNKGFWTRIGAAWSHEDGKGISIQIESVPLDGKITLRINEPRSS